MLTSGAHVSIGGIELVLARDDNGRLMYDETFESLFAPTQAIAGEIAKQQIRPEKLLWSITDWSGGEGALIYYPQDPTTYDFGSLMNPMTRGKLTTRPRRYRSSVARAGSNADTQKRPVGVSAFTHAFIAWEDNIISSPNALSWGATQDTSPAMSGFSYADAISDGVNAAFLAIDATTGLIPVISADTSVTIWNDADTGATAGAIVGCVLDGVPYHIGDAPLTLYKKAAVMDSAADWSATTIYTTGVTPVGFWGDDYWTSCTAAETSLFFSYSTKTQGYIWESRNDVGRPFWTSEPGFAIKKLIYKSGILFAIGNQSTASGRMFAGIWAIPLATRSPIFIAAPRRHQNTELRDFSVGCAGPGATIFAADAAAGKIFVYDIERDAIHLFDDLVNGGTGDGMDFVAYGNLLSSQQSSMETNTTWLSFVGGAFGAGVDGWAAETNCAITSTAAVTDFQGSRSLSMTSSAGGTMAAVTDTGTQGVPVLASTAYTAVAQVQTAFSARTCTAIIRWYDSSGTIISSSSGTGAADAVGSWTEITCTATSPANAVYAAVAIEVAATGGASEVHYVDAVSFAPGSSTDTGDKIAFLALHGTRLFGATYSPLETGATSLQVFSYDDLVPENRDASQAISATLETAEWDFGLPMERKALIGFYVTYELTDSGTVFGITANSRIKIEYSLDDAAYATAATLTSATTPVGAQGRHFIQLSDGSATYDFTRCKLRITLDNNSTAVAPPVLYGVTVEAQPLAYSRTWDLVVQVADEESNERPSSRQEKGHQIHTDLITLATNKNLVTFLDGAWSPYPNVYDTHTVIIEDPRSSLADSEGNGTMRLRLRSVLS